MTTMEPIDESRELNSNEEAASSGHHPLLNESVLKCLFKYFSVPDLKQARQVCEHWKYWATPYLREKTVVKLVGVCPLCKSEWKSNSKKIPPHDHKETISFYRFILQAQTMLLKEREEVLYKNFHISQLNLYFIPRLRPEPTKYFLSFIKLLGHKVFHLTLDNVQFCPTDSVYKILSLFRNLERVSYNNVSLWVDPVTKNSTDSTDDGKTSVSVPTPVPVPATGQNSSQHHGKINDYLTTITISGDWVSEEFLAWERIFKTSPQLNELNFLEVPKNEILNSISTLVTLSENDVRLRKLVILPRGRMEDQLDQLPTDGAGVDDCASDLEDSIEYSDEYSESESNSDNNHNNHNHFIHSHFNYFNNSKSNQIVYKNRHNSFYSKEEENSMSGIPEQNLDSNPKLKRDPSPNPTVKKKLELESLNFNHLLTQVVTTFPITELTLRLPYHGEEGMKFPEILRAGVDKFNSLNLTRHSTLFYPQTQVQFKHGPFELTLAERDRDRNKDRQKEKSQLNSEFIIFPFIKKLSLAHNFIDNFDEIKTSFPSLESLCVNIIPTEFNPRKSKSYHTYLRTTLLLSMKNASVNSTVRELVWNIEEPRNPKTGIRTVVYKTNALRHLPKIFTGLVKLCVSITRPSDLHVIFRDLEGLEELTVLKNSFYRTKDEDIIGWADCDSDSEAESGASESESESGSRNDDEESSSGIESKSNSADSILNRQRRKTKILPNPGIKQLKNLRRLSLENNNCCLTNKSLRHGFAFLQNLRYLYISRGKKIKLSALRIMTRCPYLTHINVTSPNCGNFPPDEELVAAYQHAIITQPLLDIWNGKVQPNENTNENTNKNPPEQQQQQQQEQDKTPENQPQNSENSESNQETSSFFPPDRLKKSKIPSLVNRYTPPPSTRYSMRTRTKSKKIQSRSHTNSRVGGATGGILPPLISTTSTSRKTKTTTSIKTSTKNSSLTLPPILNKQASQTKGGSSIPAPVSASVLSLGAGLAMSLPVSPLKSKKKPQDIHPELEETDLKYILSLSESELEKYEEANKKKTKVMRKKKSDEPRGGRGTGAGKVTIKITGPGNGTGTGFRTDTKPHEKLDMLNSHPDINLAHDLNISSKKLVTAAQRAGGKFEMGEKYHKIGGRRYFFVRTKYKVNGRQYSLVRRKYENEGEKEKIYAKQRAWLARKRLQQTREAAKLKNGGKSGLLEELDEQALAALRKSIEENEEESEYERSIKEYDEDDEMDELEEYCDEDNIDNDDLVTPVTSGSDDDACSDSETSAEEGIFMDDPYYEGDKEFYDYDFDSGQEEAKTQEGDGKEEKCENPTRKNSNSQNISASKNRKDKKSASAKDDKDEDIKSKDDGKIGKKRVSFQSDAPNDQGENMKTTTRTKTKTRTRMRTRTQRNDMISPSDRNFNHVESRRRSRSRSRSRSQSQCSHYEDSNHLPLYSRSTSSCNNPDNYPPPLSDYPQLIEYEIPQSYQTNYAYDYHPHPGGNNMYRKSVVKNIERSSSRLQNHVDNSGLHPLDFDSDFDQNSSSTNIIRTVQTVEKINVEKIVEIRKKPEIPSHAFELELQRNIEKMEQELHAPPNPSPIPGRSPIPSPAQTQSQTQAPTRIRISAINDNDDDDGNNNYCYNSQMSENDQENSGNSRNSGNSKNSSHSRKNGGGLNRTDSESFSQDIDIDEIPIRSKYTENIKANPSKFQHHSEIEEDTDGGFEKTLVNIRSKVIQELQEDAFKTKPKVIPTFD